MIEKIKKRITIENVYFFLLAILIINLFVSIKYSLRVINYGLLPLTIYKVYKNRDYKKIGLEVYVILFLLAIGISSIGAVDFKGVKDEFLDTLLIFSLPFIIAQFKLEKAKKYVLFIISLIVFLYKVSLSFLEKYGYIKGLYGGYRLSGGEEVWRYAAVIMVGIVVISCLLVYKKNKLWENILLILILIVSSVALIQTQNRANWVALIISFIIGAALKLGKKSIVVICLGGFLLFGIIKMYPTSKYTYRLESIVKKGDPSRVEIWKESIKIFRKNYINGAGYSYKNFSSSEDYNSYIYLPKHSHGHSHNDFLYLLATTGILGFITYLAFITKILYESFKNRNQDYCITLFLIISIKIFGFFETPVKYLDLNGFIMIALGMLYSKQIYKEK